LTAYGAAEWAEFANTVAGGAVVGAPESLYYAMSLPLVLGADASMQNRPDTPETR
jgi:hypothetical protein